VALAAVAKRDEENDGRSKAIRLYPPAELGYAPDRVLLSQGHDPKTTRSGTPRSLPP